MSYFLPRVLGMDDVADSSVQHAWMKSSKTLEDACRSARLQVEQSFRRGHEGEEQHSNNEATAVRVLRAELASGEYDHCKKSGKLEEVSKVRPNVWKAGAFDDAEGEIVIMDEHWLYVVVARKPQAD
ncbi:hypothetical protein LTR66_017109 [Elasticomyces elasticus]|nr:hypothetical protein LTR66_017109 [Elasticomyces elasticus]